MPKKKRAKLKIKPGFCPLYLKCQVKNKTTFSFTIFIGLPKILANWITIIYSIIKTISFKIKSNYLKKIIQSIYSSYKIIETSFYLDYYNILL